ncbi:hypothetical protein GPJ56_000716 [Histomonas meleagridis]|uniref:uncharacterized protein n=1 Tax=Histomonas meleagridis TaxID=135588 RepID=UPI003559C1C7|nr:hypothetical protein GPJ56_000716 [Histomonas meleagridis]KAH0804525.1 hypothetical protein GO595_003355 [Histomonas meleagridis]
MFLLLTAFCVSQYYVVDAAEEPYYAEYDKEYTNDAPAYEEDLQSEGYNLYDGEQEGEYNYDGKYIPENGYVSYEDDEESHQYIIPGNAVAVELEGDGTAPAIEVPVYDEIVQDDEPLYIEEGNGVAIELEGDGTAPALEVANDDENEIYRIADEPFYDEEEAEGNAVAVELEGDGTVPAIEVPVYDEIIQDDEPLYIEEGNGVAIELEGDGTAPALEVANDDENEIYRIADEPFYDEEEAEGNAVAVELEGDGTVPAIEVPVYDEIIQDDEPLYIEEGNGVAIELEGDGTAPALEVSNDDYDENEIYRIADEPFYEEEAPEEVNDGAEPVFLG